MSCKWCCNFRGDHYPDNDKTDVLLRMGKCCLNPETRSVRADYVCGQFSWQSVYWMGKYSTACAWYYSQLGEHNVASRETFEKMKRLREANKALRAKIKLLQGGIT